MMTPSSRLRTALAPFLAASLFLGTAACRSETPSPQPTSVGETAESGGTLLRRLESDVNTLNPILRTTGYELEVLSYLFDGLIELDINLQPSPGLATEWSVSEDGQTYVFKLDPAATWSDGTAVKASDVVFSLVKYKAHSPTMSGYFEDMNTQKTRAIDDHTVEIVFDRFHAEQIYSFGLAIVPEHVYGVGDFTRDHNDTVVSNGPYAFVRREAGEEILLERREDYTGIKPHLDAILFKILPDANVAWNALMRGEIDEMRVSTSQWDEHSSDTDVLESISFHQYYEPGYNFIVWNNRKAPLDDVRVRRAMTMAIDREAVAAVMYSGGARAAAGPYTIEQWAFNPAVRPLPYDPVEAVRLLEEAGLTDADGDGVRSSASGPFEIDFYVAAADRISVEQGQIYQDALKQVGVDVRLQEVDGTTLIEKVMSGGFDAVFLGYTLDLDPDMYAAFHSSELPPDGSNWSLYSNSEVDSLLVRAREERDFEKRRALYWELHALLAEEQPLTWLVQPSIRWAIRDRVHGVESAPGLGFFHWMPGGRAWWIPKSEQRVAGS